jgi:predicted DNA-binding transcriptional regulator YafY
VASARAKTLIRQWQLIKLLQPHARGLSVRQILEHYEGSRASLYRDRDFLRECGIPIESTNVNGEARYTLWGRDLPPLGPSALQVAALRLARRALAGLDGTGVAAELDALLAGYARATGSSHEAISFASPRVVAPELVKQLDRAIAHGRRTRLRYRSVRARAPAWRLVDPVGLRFAGGDWYFIAYDDNRRDYVPFKIDRISAVEVLADKAAAHDGVDVNALFASSAKIWRGQEVEVAVWLSPEVARLAREYPLVPHQAIEDDAKVRGACIVRAKVAGVVEAMRWVLRWGKEAEALSPEELRVAVAREVTGAAARYERRVERGREVAK